MEYKRNQATDQRPEGDRVLDAPYVFTDLDERVRQLKEEETWKDSDRNAMTIYKTDLITVVLVCLHEKAIISHGSVDGIFILQLMEGKVQVTTTDGDIEMKPNQQVAFQKQQDHSITAMDDSVILLSIIKN